jgi:hypothetical protein
MLSPQDAAIVKGMIARGDFQHDIAAHFSTNPGRIADIKNGTRFSDVKPAPVTSLPPLEKTGRHLDPNAPVAKQREQLQAFIDRPPEGSRVLVISPALAELILDQLNVNNRRPRLKNIKRFATALSGGNWQLTGDTIKFSKEGLLLDGQNRLRGALRSQKPIKTHVVFGIDKTAFANIDANAVRTNTDAFKIAGIDNSKITAPAVRHLMIGTDRGRTIDNAELLVYLEKNVDYERLQYWVNKAIEVGTVLSRPILAALLYKFSLKHEKLCERFALDLKSNKGNGKKLLDQIKEIRKQSFGRVHENIYSALLILTWNAYRANKPVTKAMLKWDESKEYPVIV